MRALAALAACLIFVATAQAEIVKFAWDPPAPNPDGSAQKIDGYKLYISPLPGRYAAPAATIGKTAISYSYFLPTSMSGKYYVVLTAYNTVGESLPSNEIEFTTKPKPAAAGALRLVP